MWDAVRLPGWPTWERALISDPASDSWEGKPCLIHPVCPIKLSRTTKSARGHQGLLRAPGPSLASAGPPTLHQRTHLPSPCTGKVPGQGTWHLPALPHFLKRN